MNPLLWEAIEEIEEANYSTNWTHFLSSFCWQSSCVSLAVPSFSCWPWPQSATPTIFTGATSSRDSLPISWLIVPLTSFNWNNWPKCTCVSLSLLRPRAPPCWSQRTYLCLIGFSIKKRQVHRVVLNSPTGLAQNGLEWTNEQMNATIIITATEARSHCQRIWPFNVYLQIVCTKCTKYLVEWYSKMRYTLDGWCGCGSE